MGGETEDQETQELLEWFRNLKAVHKVKPGDLIIARHDQPGGLTDAVRNIFNRAAEMAGLEGVTLLILPSRSTFYAINKKHARRELEKLIKQIEEEGGQDGEGQRQEDDDTGRDIEGGIDNP